MLLLLTVPALAQMRSTISASGFRSGGASDPRHSPGIFFHPGFGRHFHGNRFGTVFYPYGLYDGSYSDAVEPPTPPVIVIHDLPAAAGPVAPVQIAPAEPRLIEVPEPAAIPSNLARVPTAIFVLSDGRRLESQNYTITDTVLTLKEPHRPAVRVPLEQLNLEATLGENHKRGLDLRFPESRSEILIGF